MLTIRKISFRNIRGSQFPSRASLAAPVWREYEDHVAVPAVVLMESINTEAARVVFLSMRNIDRLLAPEQKQGAEQEPGRRQVVNSQVMHLALGDRSDLVGLKTGVNIVFRHRDLAATLANPRCVLWDRGAEAWSGRHCSLDYSNATHTLCTCNRVGSFGLVEDVVTRDSMERTTFLVMVIVAVAVSSIVIVSTVLVAVYCYRIKVRIVSAPSSAAPWRENLSVTILLF